MSTPAPDQTPQQVAQSTASTETARGATPDEVREAVAAALASHQSQPGQVELSDDQMDKIADKVVRDFEARGAFSPQEPPPSVDPNIPPAGQPGPVDGPTPPPDTQPRKLTLAERFHGRKPK